MDKKRIYIFLQNEIGNVGGGQLYVMRKIDYLRKHGWTPTVCFFLDNEVVIEPLKIYAGNFIREMQIPYASHTQRSRRRGIGKMLRAIAPAAGLDLKSGVFMENPGGDGENNEDIYRLRDRVEDVVIESYSCLTLLWGEALAAEFNRIGVPARSLIYNIIESFPIYSPNERKLLEFKIQKDQLRTIYGDLAAQKLPSADAARIDMQGGINEGENVADVPCEALEYEEKGLFTMMFLGRLDKPITRTIFKGIAEFCAAHPEAEFDMLVLGGVSKRGIAQKILAPLERVRNLRVHAAGSVYPVPRRAMRLADVMIGNSGSVAECFREGVRCVVVDGRDGEGIGIYAEDTDSFVLRKENEPRIHIRDLIERVYKEWLEQGDSDREPETKEYGKCKGNSAELNKEAVEFMKYDEEAIFSEHHQWLDTAEYAIWPELDSVRPSTLKEKILGLIMRLKGENLIYLLKRIKNGE